MMLDLWLMSLPPHRKSSSPFVFLVAFLLAGSLPAVAPAQQGKPAKVPIFVDPAKIDLALVLMPPPSNTSQKTKDELSEIHSIERNRTSAMIAAAEYDDVHEDIFLYSAVLDSSFQPQQFPLTMSLSAHLRNDASLIDNPLKRRFGRPRPYNLDSSLHAICETNKENSYPSGHALNGYLYAYALAQIVPEKQAEILKRADEYAHNRLVCEAHYPTDIEASRRIALVIFGYLLANPRFVNELTAARTETRQLLHLPEMSAAH